MKTNALNELETDAPTMKRAQWGAFEFDVCDGTVTVRNGSYGDDADEHTYTVTVRDGVPSACECPADEFRPGACKHRVAVAIREPVLEAACAPIEGDGAVAVTDGGTVSTTETRGESAEDAPAHAPGCDNPECEGFDAPGRPLLSFECWDVWAASSEGEGER